MWDLLNHPTVQACLSVVLILAIACAGYWVAKAVRPAIGIADTNDDGIAQNFAEMQREGDISEAELRRIKAVLGKSQQTLEKD